VTQVRHPIGTADAGSWTNPVLQVRCRIGTDLRLKFAASLWHPSLPPEGYGDCRWTSHENQKSGGLRNSEFHSDQGAVDFGFAICDFGLIAAIAPQAPSAVHEKIPPASPSEADARRRSRMGWNAAGLAQPFDKLRGRAGPTW